MNFILRFQAAIKACLHIFLQTIRFLSLLSQPFRPARASLPGNKFCKWP